MIQINPRESIKLVYLIGDTTDENIYYVQAVMRDSTTNAILETVNLTQASGNTRRFTGSMDAPAYAGAGAYYIDITLTPYTDSGYSQIAAAYPETLLYYQISYRWSVALGGGGSGGPGNGVDFKKMHAELADNIAQSMQRMLSEMPVGGDPIDVDALRSGIVKDIKKHFKAQKQAKQKVKDDKEFNDGIDKLSHAMGPLGAPGAPEPSFNEGGARIPSSGVVPYHVAVRTKAKFGK